MTNNKKISLVLGIMCFALTLGIVVQMRTVSSTNSTVSQNYEENNLRGEVLKYKEKYENKYKELEKAQENLEETRKKTTKNNGELEEAENQIKQANKINGTTDVTGPGIIITLTDGKSISNTLNPSELIVHYLDILSVVNELKNAGAEAVSINDQRIVNTTGISCSGNIIDINKEKVGSPFVIQAIGLPEYLANLSRPGGYLEQMKDDGVNVKLEKSNNITIPKFNGVMKFKYLKNAKQKILQI